MTVYENENVIYKEKDNDKIFNKLFVTVFLANMTFGLGAMMSNSLLAVYAHSIGSTASQIGFLMGVFSITGLSFRFVAGPALDSMNRKYLLLFSIIIMIISYLGFSFSTTYEMLILFRLIQGIGNAFGMVSCFAIATEAIPRKHFNKGIGYYSLAMVVAQALGPSTGLFLVDLVGYSNVYLINAMIMFVSAILTLSMQMPFRLKRKFSFSLDSIIAKEAIIPTMISFFVVMVFVTINAFLIVSAAENGVVNGIGLFFTTYAVTMFVSRPLITNLVDRFGFVKIGIPAILMTVLSFIIISQAHSLYTYLLAAFVNAFGFGAVFPAIQTLVIKTVEEERSGSATSTNFIGIDLSNLIGPLIAGFFVENYGYSIMWLAMIIPLLLGIIIIVVFRNHINNIEENFANSL